MAANDLEKDLRNIKLTIKTWESEFTKLNQRKPNQEDIQLTPSYIKDAYKRYWSLKRKIDSQKTNQDDVWSEKLNKVNEKKTIIDNSEKIFQKFCNKIKQRSSDLTQKTHEKSSEEKLMCPVQTQLKSNGDSCNRNTYKSPEKCIDADFSELENEMKLIKPIIKITKFNNVPKKLQSVNVLSSSVYLKNFEKKLSFETSLDSEWLERCYSDTVNDSFNNAVNDSFNKTVNDSFNNTVKRKYASLYENEMPQHDFDESDTKTDENVDLSSNSDLKNVHFKSPHYTDKITDSFHNNCSEILSNGVTENNEVSAESVIPDCNVDEKQNKKLNNHTANKQLEEICPNENALDSSVQEINKSKKRKLTRAYSANHPPSSHLERKMASGTLNENYVRVNIKKKTFSRGHKSINIKKLKWKKWKEMKMAGSGSGNMSSPSGCFKCGQLGHWARNCKVQPKEDKKLEEDFEDLDDVCSLPTLEEAAALAKQSKINLSNTEVSNVSKRAEVLSDETINSKEEGNEFVENDIVSSVEPIYEPSADGRLLETPAEVFESLKELGYSNFRKGQETAVMRILNGLSTLVVLPTGSGKSLCYQLPAYIYSKHFKCITLVISPLVSLMEDQVIGLPSCLNAICIHSGMTEVQKKASLQDLKEGKAQILLVSPEALIGYGSGTLSLNMPPIAFACIDEAHCLSQWSHNFRPSYLQLYKVLTEFFHVKCILGLTASANRSTVREVITHLGLKNSDESVIGSTSIPQNLHLSVSRDKDKDRALIQLLLGNRFSVCSSIIIYCIRRDETERLATLIRTCLQDQISDEPQTKKAKPKSKKRNFLWTAEAYHAGLAPPRRRSIQKQFMSGKLRVIVATIAFGMGLDKKDVRAIIHYNMPKSFESYIQEIGRAGRDGLDSHCHLFLDNEGRDIQELQRFIYSNSTDRYVIRKLLKKVFIPQLCKAEVAKHSQSVADEKTSEPGLITKCPKHEIAFSISETVQELDLKEENILTLLCYLELHSKKWIEVLPPTYSTCAIRCYGGPRQLKTLALKSPPVAAAFAINAEEMKNLEHMSAYQFEIVKIASVMGWKTSSVKHALKNLEWNDKNRKTGVIVEFSNLAFHLRSPCNLSDDELDDVLDFLYEKVIASEKKELWNLRSLHNIFAKFSHPHYWACSDEAPVESSEAIKEAVNKYFDEADNLENIESNSLMNSDDIDKVDVSEIRSQIRDLIFTNTDHSFTGRAIARIFHGIGSPGFPSEVWGRVRNFWRCLLHVNFNFIMKLANEELKRAK